MDNAAELLVKRLNEPIREINETFIPSVLLSTQSVLVIPSGGLDGYENTSLLKASLDEYVKQGGTLIVLSQKHGYDYAILPTPDGKPITGYGWEEDINCFADAFSIDTWHQMLSGQSRATPTANVDGYFTSWPENSTILLRRTVNGQPALFMYPLGGGRVIVTSMYSDWAYGHGQTSADEIALIRDMISWAKNPTQLLEVKPGQTISVPVTLTNTTATDAASVKFQIYNPDRSSLLSEQPVNLPVSAGQPTTTTVSYQTSSNSPLGIYHIDYILLDSNGEIIQPQAESDSGRFVMSNPPTNLQKSPDFNFAVNSDSERYPRGSDAAFTVTMYNNTDAEKTITAKYYFPHHWWETGETQYGGDWYRRDLNLTKIMTVSPRSSVNFVHVLNNARASIDRLWAYFYDETGKQVGDSSRGFYVFTPAVSISTQTNKLTYAKGETVNLVLNVQNRKNAQSAVNLQVRVTDPLNIAVYTNSLPITLTANGASTQNLSFVLPATAQGGFYTISAEVFDAANNKKIGGDSASFELPLSQISVAPVIPSTLAAGTNTVSFNLSNTGKLAVSNGTLDVALKDPAGAVAASASQPFALAAGQSTAFDVPINIPALKFGSYTLSYTQNDDTKSGKPVNVSLDNTVAATVSFDKTSYRIRETANLTVSLANTGRFNQENVSVAISISDAGYSNTEVVAIAPNQNITLNRAITLPDTMTAGQHSVTVTLTLPGGSSVTKSVTFTVPQSSLSLSLSQTAYTAGSTVSPVITNSGGVDTQAQYRISLYDSKSALIADKTLTETVSANGALTLILPIPGGAMDGNYDLVVKYTDVKTGGVAIFQKLLTITGVKASLALQTDKQSYLSTDSITALSDIVNGGAALQGGNLHIQVTTAGGSQVTRTWTTTYDFQQGTRSDVDTFETPDTVTLIPVSDNFNDGVLNTDRWLSYQYVPQNSPPVEQNGALQLYLPPNPSYNWIASYLDSKFRVTGDFDATVDYNITSPWNAGANSHPAVFYVLTNTWAARIVVWGGSPTYGVVDSYGSYKNIGGARTTGKLRIRRISSTYYTYYWNGSSWINAYNFGNRPSGPAGFSLACSSQGGNVTVLYDNFTLLTHTYPASGKLNLKYDSGRSDIWDKLSFTGDIPTGTSIKFRTRTADTESGLTSAAWSSYITTSGSQITSPKGRWIEVEATLATTDTAKTPTLHDITVTQGHAAGDILWQADVPVNLAPGAVSNLSNAIAALGAAGKYYLQGTLTSTTGQSIATTETPVYVIQGNTTLTLNTDKKAYKPGETVTITGEVKNLASVDVTNLSLALKAKDSSGVETTIYTESFNVPAGDGHPFIATTVAGAQDTFVLTGTVTLDSTTLVQLADQYLVASPVITATASIPDVAGNDPIAFTVEIKNDGKVAASVIVQPSFDAQMQPMTIPAGETKRLQYSQQIAADTAYTFVITGDLNQTISKTVKYGLAGTVALTPQAIYPEGKITVPATITNAGLLGGQLNVDYQLNQGANSTNQQAKSYYLPKGGNAADTLSFDLPEGSYQLTATGQLPVFAASAAFSVRKEVKADLLLSVGTQTGTLLPATVNVTNLGYNPIDGTVRLSLVDGSGAAVWSSNQDVSLPQSLVPGPRSMAFSINLAAVKPGDYTIKAELLDTANRQLAIQTTPFALLAPTFEITQLPPYQTIPAGGSATMTFEVMNSGNQEGSFDLSFKADDLIDSTRTEWLKPGEVMEIAFTFSPPADLEEKDYAATYRLKTGGATVREGVVAYHPAGIKLAVSATLDRQNYNVGDAANLTLTITQQDAGAAPNLFARVNYNGYEDKRDFTLHGSQTLTFTVPLERISGEKLFYGIYHEAGRSIHLNTIYIHKADGVLTVTTDKQVYDPGEAVTVSINGTAAGDLTLTGPGDFVNIFAFSGADTRSFVLPSTMTAGTYSITAQLKTQNQEPITVAYPIDVAGIQVKVKEALLDKARYAATDAMRLALTIESNLDIPATIKTWVVDPAGSYTPAGESGISLTASSPLLVTHDSSLSTASLGIHKLVYGIYQGDLLLASGAKAFDIGEAVLIGLSTDKADYPEITSAVTAKADLYGSADAGLEFFLDGTSIKNDTVTLAGFTGSTLAITPAGLTPGMHRLRAVLTSDGLTSTKETSFTYGSNLPDLTVRLASDAVKGSSLMLTATVGNQGKTASAATTAALYDQDPAQGGTPVATLNVPALAPNATATLPYAWNVLGKAGDYVVHAVVDPANMVTEYDEANNTTLTTGSLPKLALGVSTGGTSFHANTEVGIAVNYANLGTSDPYQDLVLQVELTNPQGVVSLLKETTIASLAPATEATDATVWNTMTSPPGSYAVNARLLDGGSPLLAGSAAFTVEPTLAVTGALTLNNAEIGQGTTLTVAFTLGNSGNVNTDGVATALVIDPQSNVIKATAEQPANLPVNGSHAGEFTFPSQELELKSYLVSLRYVSQENQYTVADASFIVRDGTPPVLTVLSPEAGTSYNSMIALAVLATDDASGVEKVEYQLDDGAWNILPVEDAVTGGYRAAWQPTVADNGVHTVRFRGVDRAANTSGPVSVAFSFDTVPPVLTLSTLSDGAYTNNETLNIAGNVRDDVGLGELWINDAAVPVDADGGFSHALILENGTNTVTAIAADLAKNRSTDTRTISLDQTAPVLVVTAPADNSKTGNPLIEVTGSVDENATVEVKVKENVQYAGMNGTAFTATVGLESGLNTIEITARDLAANPSSQKRTVLYDDQKPSLSVTEPNQDIRTNRSSIMVQGTASDPFTAVGVTITMDTEILTPSVINGAFEQVVTFTEEKPYAINVTATNEVGTQVSVQRNVIYDITPPTLSVGPVTSPTNKASQVVTGSREEGTIVAVTCATAVVGEVSYPTASTWQTSIVDLKEGVNTITATSTDAAGNQTTAAANIIFVERAPDVTITATPDLLWPPNHSMVPVTLGGEAIPHGSELQSVSISVADEYGEYGYNNLKFGATVVLEAWREGNDLNGRVYTITAVATDSAGNTTTKATTVIVPHDMSK